MVFSCSLLHAVSVVTRGRRFAFRHELLAHFLGVVEIRLIVGGKFLAAIGARKEVLRFAPVDVVIGGAGSLVTTQAVPGLVYSPGTFYRVRVQVTGANPTTIKMKLWVDGQAEPADWQYTATDSAAANQGSGWVGFRTYISASATNGPVAVSYDDLRVKSP